MGFDLPTLPARPSSSTPTRTPTRTLNGPLIPRAALHYPPVHPARTLYGACPFVAGSVLVGRMIWFSLVLRIASALVRISIWELVGPHNSRPVKVIGVDVVTDTDIWVETKAETFIEFTYWLYGLPGRNFNEIKFSTFIISIHYPSNSKPCQISAAI